MALLICASAYPALAHAQFPPAPPPAITIPACNDYRLKNDHPLLAKQRACIWAGNLVTPGAIFGAAFSSAYGQITKDDPGWGQGVAGYARRFGGRYAQGVTKATAEYLSSWAFREDPRPTRSACLSWKRIFCAAESLVAQPSPSGGTRPVFSKVIGAFAGGFIGMTYYPQSGTVNQSLRRSGTSLATSLLSVEIYEFQPEIFGWLGAKFSPKSTPAQAGAPSRPRP